MLLLQISPLITEVENIFGDPWLFPAASFKYLRYQWSRYPELTVLGQIALRKLRSKLLGALQNGDNPTCGNAGVNTRLLGGRWGIVCNVQGLMRMV